MKKGLIVLGNSQFCDKVNFENSNYQINKKLLVKLGKNYCIDDFSNDNLKVNDAINFLNVFIKKRNYSNCILALGLADLGKTDPEEFKLKYNEIVNILLINNIEPVIVTLPSVQVKNELASCYQNIINEIAEKHSLDCISPNTRKVNSKLRSFGKEIINY